MAFSLIDDPWIACVRGDGTQELISLRQVFGGAAGGESPVVGLRGDSPAQDYAVLRLLLAIFWRAHSTEIRGDQGTFYEHDEWFRAEWAAAASGEADTTALDYLEKYRERFDLLHAETPFMQVADLHTEKGARLEARRIVPEAEDEYFTMRAGRARGSLSFAEAARWLIHAQAYDYSGIKSGAVGDPRVKGGKGYPIGTGWTGNTGGTVILGSTLRETLVLNTTPDCLVAEPDVDWAAWERQPDTAAQRKPEAEAVYPTGPADLATWQSRRVRLFHDGERVTEVLVSNGDRIPEAGANIMDDPMTPYRYSANKSKKGHDVYYPRPFDTDRTMWKSLEPLLALEGDPGFTEKSKAPKRPRNLTQLAELRNLEVVPEWANIQMVSVAYGPQSSSIAEVVASAIEIPVGLLREEARRQRRLVLDNAQATATAAIALGSFAGQLNTAAGGEYEFQSAPTDTLLSRLELPFSRWLAGLDEEKLEDHARQWQGYVRGRVLAEAEVLLRGVSPQGLVGREKSPASESGKPYIESAATVLHRLHKKLDEALPTTVRVRATEGEE
ncbi:MULTISPECIES: type I-E CRISPR-associated protein Cse1/CasA [unclassified Corynebacterium]|uniref:type I-E CRISPR-associated protein Cse1/CasA n=1 Tax=unclassified Corynebacterium TaxID=2624378 RepID=UPI0029CA7FE3|nr:MULTISPECIES: type I-E CRISPR-associated protein Cse1/CasA [unclassified Corynebacterium]WPF66254.1 type I-E CRISPR-associated protein Cse1/CasA [Corynebacterium sp. 22KM0430]WPF68744.1 type I-E CRISPR-associated protein Cse1/CasA [Corynebacterium sp. 21KM1197]